MSDNQPTPEPVTEEGTAVESTPAPAQPSPATASATKAKQPLAEQVSKELQVAWQFTKQKVFPAIVAGITFVVDTIDPPLAQLGQNIATKVQANPNWQKLVSSNAWQQLSTVASSLSRTVGEWWGKATAKITLSPELKHILSKRAAVSTIVIVLLAISVLKPGPAKAVAKPKPKPPAITKTLPANIESAIMAVAQPYGSGLIQEVYGSTQLGRLVISLGEMWYQLAPEQQDNLVQGLQTTANKLRLGDVIITDYAHHLIARPAVVGNTLVIVRR